MSIFNIGISYGVRDNSGKPFVKFVVIYSSFKIMFTSIGMAKKRFGVMHYDRQLCEPALIIVTM